MGRFTRRAFLRNGLLGAAGLAVAASDRLPSRPGYHRGGMSSLRRHPPRGRAAMLALVAVVLAAAPVSAQTDAVREAERLVAARDFAAAARVLRAHLAREPGDLEAAPLISAAARDGDLEHDVGAARH